MEIIMTEMLWAAVLLVVGFVLLIKGADFFVEEALPWQRC